jgi:hypothetical protein
MDNEQHPHSQNNEQQPQDPQNEINWDSFNKNSASVLKAVIDEIGISSIDRDPGETEKVHNGVLEAVRFASHESSGYDHIPNNLLASIFKDCALEQFEQGNIPVADELRGLSQIFELIARPRYRKK